MTILIFTLVIVVLIFERVLFSAIEEEKPDYFEKLGSPGFFTLMLHPGAILKFWVLILFPSPFSSNSRSYKWLWLMRVSLFSLFLVIVIYSFYM